MNFAMTFWGSKNEIYMLEIVPTVLSQLKAGVGNVWSWQDLKAIDFDNGAPIA